VKISGPRGGPPPRLTPQHPSASSDRHRGSRETTVVFVKNGTVTKRDSILFENFLLAVLPLIMNFFPPYRGLSQFFKSQPTQNIDDSNPVGNTWGHNAQIYSSPRKDMTGFVSLDDDPIELTRIQLRHDIYVETSTHESKDGLV
jgi:hypothetical protein